jgi:hypothetical protein
MLRHLLTQAADGPLSIARFSPDGQLLLTCAAFTDEVNVWRIDPSARQLERVSGFAAGCPERHFRDAAWLADGRVVLCGLRRPLQVWGNVTGGPASLLAELTPGADEHDSPLRLFAAGTDFVLDLVEAGITWVRGEDYRVIARDDRGAGVSQVLVEESLVATTFADQAASRVMFGRLQPHAGDPASHGAGASVEWLPLAISQSGALHGIAVDPLRRSALVFHGLQGACITILGVPECERLGQADFESVVRCETANPDQFGELLVWDEGTLCRPVLAGGHLIYPGLTGILLVVADVFGRCVACPVEHYTGAIASLAVVGRLLAVASHDGRVSLWELPPAAPRGRASASPPLIDQFREMVAALGERLRPAGRHTFFKGMLDAEWTVRPDY